MISVLRRMTRSVPRPSPDAVVLVPQEAAILLVPLMRTTLLAVAALAFLRIVLGLHFFLEGLSHLRDPEWSSAGFRKAAVGPWADWYRGSLPQTGDWSGTLAAVDGRSAEDAAKAWQESVVAGWKKLLAERQKRVPLAGDARGTADTQLTAATKELADYVAGIQDELADYRLQAARFVAMERKPGAAEIPFERERIAKKRRELASQAAGWMNDAEAIGQRLVGRWDELLDSDASRIKAAAAAPPSALWKADRFVSWALVTIGGCLVLGLAVKFNAMGGALFLLTVIASQPFWVPGAQATYDQWVELAALLAVAALPTGGWSGLDHFLEPVLKSWCPLSSCCSGAARATPEVTR
jgi:uncharacterized membrane protein YphA (DoxX/SURF4 family)